MKKTTNTVRFLYGTYIGRILLKIFMGLHLDRAVVCFLRSPYSKPVGKWYIKRHGIDIPPDEADTFGTFRDMFARTRVGEPVDNAPDHLISPCDGWLSVFEINDKSCFDIKNSHYCLKDFLQDEKLAEKYIGGTCMIFRLCVSDYHHYCYIDNGRQGENHFIPGVLHSVQPIACETFPVFVLNRRSWCLMETENFGPVVQCEIGALIIGGIHNEKENASFEKGSEKGHFELAGSTIILLFEKGRVDLHSDITEQLETSDEARVTLGKWIATANPM